MLLVTVRLQFTDCNQLGTLPLSSTFSFNVFLVLLIVPYLLQGNFHAKEKSNINLTWNLTVIIWQTMESYAVKEHKSTWLNLDKCRWSALMVVLYYHIMTFLKSWFTNKTFSDYL